MKKRTKKLNLTRETVSNLDPEKLQGVGGEAAAAITTQQPFCRESVMVCSVMHTCYSCNNNDTTIIAV